MSIDKHAENAIQAFSDSEIRELALQSLKRKIQSNPLTGLYLPYRDESEFVARKEAENLFSASINPVGLVNAVKAVAREKSRARRVELLSQLIEKANAKGDEGGQAALIDPRVQYWILGNEGRVSDY